MGAFGPSVRNRLFVLVGLAAGFCVAAAIVLYVASTVPFEATKVGVLAAVGSNFENRFTPALYAHFITSTRLLAALLLAAGGLLAVAANRVESRLEDAFSGVQQLTSEMAAGVRTLCTEDRLHLTALCSITAWAILIRCRYLFEPMRYDEGYSFLAYASRPLFVGLSYFSANNHILNTVLTHSSYVLFGDAPWALRLPALMAGIAVVPLTYAAMRVSSNRNAALLSAALVSSSFPLVEYSTSSRGYTLGTAFLLGMLFFVALARRAPAAWIPASICAGLSVYSVVTMSFGVAGVLLWALWTTRSVRFTARLAIGTAVMGVLLYAPILITGGLSSFTSTPWAGHLPMVVHVPIRELIPALLRSAIDVWNYWNMRLPLALTILTTAGVAAGIVQWIATGFSRPPVFLLLTISWLAFLLAERLNAPRRAWLFLLPLYLGTAAQGWEFLSDRYRKATAAMPAIAVLVCVWMGVEVLRSGELYRPHNPDEYGFPNAERLVLDHKQYLERGSAVVYSSDPAPLGQGGRYDVPIQFAMFRLGICYKPSPSGELLIVAAPGEPPLRSHDYKSEAPLSDIQVIRKIAAYEDADVYLGKRVAKSSQAVPAPAASAGK